MTLFAMGTASGEIGSTVKGRRLIPVLVFGNKIDSHGAVSEEELREWLRLSTRKGGKAGGEGRPVELFMCSVVTAQGYQNGFEWLARHV